VLTFFTVVVWIAGYGGIAGATYLLISEYTKLDNFDSAWAAAIWPACLPAIGVFVFLQNQLDKRRKRIHEEELRQARADRLIEKEVGL